VLVIVVARPFLRERMTPARIAFVIAGIVGTRLIVRPGTEIFRGASLLALMAAGAYARPTLAGSLVFGEFPDRWSMFGMAVIGGSLAIALCERRSARSVTALAVD
jgi:drug/metabolite transporter (DMT)-like permease